MQRNKQGLLVAVVFGLWLCLAMVASGYAQMQYRLVAPDGREIALSAVNQKRETESLVLYTPEYGSVTRTNPYGVEVAAFLVPGSTNRYKVVKVASIWDCQTRGALTECGNMAIPQQGVVLSATGNKRDMLLKHFQPGAEFHLETLYIHESRITLDAHNPTPQTNPSGSGFPGVRGGNQLIMYDVGYGQPSTGTNEFGFEVTVKEGRVVAHEGSNSSIPTEPESFVLSGHGKAGQWLIQNAPLGSHIFVYNGVVTSTVDRDTYFFQLDRIVSRIEALNPELIPPNLKDRLTTLRLRAMQLPDNDIAREALALREELTPILWASYPTVSQSVPRAIWHRPSESTLQEVRQSLDLIQKAGFNTLFLETYLHGDPIFPSATFEAYNIPVRLAFELKDGPRDLLKVWLDEAHKRNMKVHVWFQTFYAGNRQYDNHWGNILNTYPQWANVQRSALGKSPLPPSTLEAGAYFLDPANQEVQNFLLSLIEEIFTRYPVDGFQLDYIRYPSSFPPDRYSYVATTWGYTPVARSLFESRYGVDPATLSPRENPQLWEEWNQFKTRQVDRFVQKVHSLVKTRRPDLPLSVAIFPKPEDSLLRKHQNWMAWAQNGWIDLIAPMTLTSSLESIFSGTREVREQTHVPVITGIFGPFNGNSPSEVVDQVWTAFSAGATGIALFDTAHLTQQMAEALQMGIFKTRQTPAP